MIHDNENEAENVEHIHTMDMDKNILNINVSQCNDGYMYQEY